MGHQDAALKTIGIQQFHIEVENIQARRGLRFELGYSYGGKG